MQKEKNMSVLLYGKYISLNICCSGEDAGSQIMGFICFELWRLQIVLCTKYIYNPFQEMPGCRIVDGGK